MATNNKTSVLVDSLLPDYLEAEGPKFQAFVKAYYEWMEQTGQVTDQSKNLLSNRDIDLAAEEFLNYFKREILPDFPQTVLADKRLLYKRIKDLYRAKGSEQAYKLLFRILYNEEVDFYYPGQDLLRASDGRWVKETSIRISNPITGDIDTLSGEITGKTSQATAKIERVTQIVENGVSIYELFVTNISGTFLDGEEIRDTAGDRTGTIVSKQGSLQKIIIINGGSGHVQNDTLSISSASGTGGRATVNVTSNGAIVTATVSNTGTGFLRSDPLTISNLSRVAANATGAALVTAPVNYEGRYQGVKGFLSWSNKLQDNRYYQEFSYVLRSGQVLDTYKEIVKSVVHPAGLKFFGDVLINIVLDNASPKIARENVILLSDKNPSVLDIPFEVSGSESAYMDGEETAAVDNDPEIEYDLQAVQADLSVYINDKENHIVIINKEFSVAPRIEQQNDNVALITEIVTGLATPLVANNLNTVRTNIIFRPGKISDIGINDSRAIGDITVQEVIDFVWILPDESALSPTSNVNFNTLAYRGLATVPKPFSVAPGFFVDTSINSALTMGVAEIDFLGGFTLPSITSTFSVGTDYGWSRNVDDSVWADLQIQTLHIPYAQLIDAYASVSLDTRVNVPTTTIVGADITVE